MKSMPSAQFFSPIVDNFYLLSPCPTERSGSCREAIIAKNIILILLSRRG